VTSSPVTAVNPPTELRRSTPPVLVDGEMDIEGYLSPLLEPNTSLLIQFWADTLNDVEAARMMAANRYRTFTSNDESNKQLTFAMKDHPLYDWVQSTKGIGLKTVGRYIASVGGDPAWHNQAGRQRTLRELWSYSGLAVIDGKAPTRQRGQQANWKSAARTRAWNIAAPIIRTPHPGPYRIVYDEARDKYRNSVHAQQCKRCGPSGNPALEGSPLGRGHQHARGIRAIMKAVTKDMWQISHDLHEESHD